MTCRYLHLWYLVAATTLTSCYSFKGITIAPEISTFFVDQFQNSTGTAPPDIGQRFSEDLKERILNNSRLLLNEDVPDIEFTGSVTSFSVQSVAPQRDPNSTNATQFGSSINRLNISVQVNYVNNLDDEDSWSQSFSFFQDFDNTQNLTDIQDQFITDIFVQIITDVFNRSFTNW